MVAGGETRGGNESGMCDSLKRFLFVRWSGRCCKDCYKGLYGWQMTGASTTHMVF